MNHRKIIVSILIFIGLSVTIWHINLKPLIANRNYAKVIEEGNIAKKTELFKQAVAYRTFGDSENRYLAMHQVYLQAMTKDMEVKENAEFSELVLNELEKSLDYEPKKARDEYSVGRKLLLAGEYKGAVKHLEIAKSISPKQQIILMNLGIAYAYLGEFERAIELFDEATYLTPAYVEPAKLKKELLETIDSIQKID